ITTLLAFAFVLGVLVFVHELGHFLAAKRVGIRIIKFQLGFNPTIASFRYGDTEYGIGALPLGGYVKMAGENPDEARSGKDDEFLSKSKWQRFQVLIMGPTMNLLLAIVLTAIVLHHGAEVPAFLDQPAVVGAVVAASPAERAGIKPGDAILAVNGERISFRTELMKAIAARPGEKVTVTISRNGVRQDIPVVPALGGCAGVASKIGCIGVAIAEPTKIIKPSAIEAVGMSFQKNAEFAGLIFQTLWGLVTRETSPRQLMGPVAIAQLSGESAQLGWIALMTLMASISLNLGLLNLLPIPVLDGGHIFIMALEGIARRDFSTQVKEKMFLAGFVLLLMLMVTVIYNDLTRIPLFENLMPWR